MRARQAFVRPQIERAVAPTSPKHEQKTGVAKAGLGLLGKGLHMRICSVAPLAAAIAVGCGGGAAFAEQATRISGPHMHANLAVYFVHGPSSDGAVPLTLQEALANSSVQVVETGRVNELQIENSGSEPVFIQT